MTKAILEVDVVVIGTATRDIFLIANEFESVETGHHPALILPAETKLDIPNISSDIGGGAPNAATTFARVGLRSACLAKIGVDAFGREVEAMLQEEGVHSLLVEDKSHQTGISVVLKGPNGEDTALIHRGAGYEYGPKDFQVKNVQAKWAYVTSLGGDLRMLQRIMTWATKSGVRVAINPGSLELEKTRRLIPLLRQADVVLLNESEAARLTGEESPLKALAAARAAGMHTVVITQSGCGSYVLDGNYVYQSGLYKKVTVVDRTGAGYAYGAGLIAAIIRGKAIPDAMSFAAANATSVIGYLGSRVGILTNMEVDIIPVNISIFHNEE